MSILVQKSGFLSTIQDLGRTNYRRFGINPNGAMDKTAARLINILLGNSESEAVLEMHFPAPKLLFETAAIVSLGGADFGANINGKIIENWRPFFIEKESVLSFDKKNSGNRAYLSVKGGFEIERWFGSASTNLAAKIGGFGGRSLSNGDKLFFRQKPTNNPRRANYKISESLIPRYNSFPTVRVIKGAEFKRLTASGARNFPKQNFTISRASDRMGFRLQSESLSALDAAELVSSAVDFGTIQLLPDGQLMILMADCQTSGGYPRIAHIASVDLPLVAQLGAGDRIKFEIVSLHEAEDLKLEFERDLNLLKIGVNLNDVFR